MNLLLIPSFLLWTINLSLVVSILFLSYFAWLNQKITCVIEVNTTIFSKLQSIIEFRIEMRDNEILNAPKVNKENCIDGVYLTFMQKRKSVLYYKKAIKHFENEIAKEAGLTSLDKYL